MLLFIICSLRSWIFASKRLYSEQEVYIRLRQTLAPNPVQKTRDLRQTGYRVRSGVSPSGL